METKSPASIKVVFGGAAVGPLPTTLAASLTVSRSQQKLRRPLPSFRLRKKSTLYFLLFSTKDMTRLTRLACMVIPKSFLAV